MISGHIHVSLVELYDQWTIDDVQDAHLVIDAIEAAQED